MTFLLLSVNDVTGLHQGINNLHIEPASPQ